MTPSTFSLALESLFELDPALLAARLVARDDGFAERVFDAFEIDFDFIADPGAAIAAMAGEFLERHAALGLQTDIDDGDILFDGDDTALDDRTFESLVLAIAFGEQSGKIVTRRVETRVVGRATSILLEAPIWAAPVLGWR